MKKTLKFLGMALVLTGLFFTSASSVTEASEVVFSVDGDEFFWTNYDSEEIRERPISYLSNNRTMVPLRTISEALGHYVQWDNKAQKITIDENLAFKIGNKNLQIKKENRNLTMDAAAEKRNGITYVPVRFISEILDHKVEYVKFGQTNRINIIKEYKKRVEKAKKVPATNYNEQYGQILNNDLNSNELFFEILEYVNDDYSPNGYHINHLNQFKSLRLTPNTQYYILDFIHEEETGEIIRKVTKEEFNFQLSAPFNLISHYTSAFYLIDTKGDEVIKIQAAYTP